MDSLSNLLFASALDTVNADITFASNLVHTKNDPFPDHERQISERKSENKQDIDLHRKCEREKVKMRFPQISMYIDVYVCIHQHLYINICMYQKC